MHSILPAFSALNAGFTLLVGAIVVAVGIYHGNRITRDRYNETIDDYATIARGKEERVDELTKRVAEQGDTILLLTRRAGEAEGRYKILLERNFLLDRYCRQLQATLRLNRLSVPPRPDLVLPGQDEVEVSP